ncbi:unnamed protein product [Ambrosiozyma monospora]|uniref:Unnamed protein product n=1 Tax=Ambrosiozyma monospora TaxID=43982 RepID=A0ACB5TJV8_AMBMO|nr:unnamed protein product [Ambrosiozyma monospora]
MPEIYYTNIVDDNGEFLNSVRTDVMYVNGACRGHAKNYQPRHAGLGIYLGENDIRNKSIYLGNADYTNQYVELMAVYESPKWISQLWSLFPNVKHTIRTDSKYAFKALTKWFHKWQRNGWRNSHGMQVPNRRLINDCLKYINDINKKYATVCYGDIEIQLVEDEEDQSLVDGIKHAYELVQQAIDDSIESDEEFEEDLYFSSSDEDSDSHRYSY